MGICTEMVHDVGLIAFPWRPSLDSGRGHDTYAYHLLRCLSGSGLSVREFPLVSVNRLQQGVNRFEYAVKEFLFLTKILHPKAKIYHGISPLGSKTAIIAGKHPLVTTIHDAIPFFHRRDVRQSYERKCIKLCCDGSEEIIVSSFFTGNFLRKELGLNPKKIRVVRYGVDHEFFFRNKSKRQTRTVFSIVRWNDMGQFLSAFRTVRKEVGNARLILGLKNSSDGDYKGQMPQLLKKYDLEDSVEVLYDIPAARLPYYYNSADLYVSASMGGFTLTLLEAMACGVPVLAFDIFEVAEYVGKVGVLVKPGDFQELSDEMIRLLLDATLNEKLAEQSHRESLNFSWEKMSSETIECYKNLL
jgi:glycosyltransferase involved in cell wall biosynthesis